MARQNGRENNMLQTLIKVKSQGFSDVRTGRILHAKIAPPKQRREPPAANTKVKKT